MKSTCKKQYDNNKNIPPNLYSKYIQVISQSKQIWQKSKSDNDFKTIVPHLKEIIEITKEMYSYSKPNVDTYNALLDDYEKGIGYFPSYSLGNIYSGQFLNQIEKELRPIDCLVENDKLEHINN